MSRILPMQKTNANQIYIYNIYTELVLFWDSLMYIYNRVLSKIRFIINVPGGFKYHFNWIKHLPLTVWRLDISWWHVPLHQPSDWSHLDTWKDLPYYLMYRELNIKLCSLKSPYSLFNVHWIKCHSKIFHKIIILSIVQWIKCDCKYFESFTAIIMYTASNINLKGFFIYLIINVHYCKVLERSTIL